MTTRLERELELLNMMQTEEGRAVVLKLYLKATASPRSMQRRMMIPAILATEYPHPGHG